MGKIGQAIEQTIHYYPGLLESNENLLFLLKCRQFIEMVNGCDTEVNSLYDFAKSLTAHCFYWWKRDLKLHKILRNFQFE